MKHNQVRRFIADILAMIILSTVAGMIIEIGIAKYALMESIWIRLSAMIPNILTARFNGMFTDFVRNNVYAARPGQTVKKLLADITAFMLFQVPLYAIVQGIATYPHIDVKKIAISCGTVTIISLFIGRPYGLLLDLMRKVLRVPSQILGESKNP